jgi:uncharacterized membrane protein
MVKIAAILFYVLSPALILYLCHRFSFLGRIGAAVLSFITGMVLANAGAVPAGLGGIQKLLMSLSIPLAIPLMLFPTDIKRWYRLAGKSLGAFALFTAALLVMTFVGYFMFRASVDEADKIGGMFVAGFTGATVNFMGVALALKTKPENVVLATAVSWFLEIFWLLFVMFLGQRVIGKVLRPFTIPDAAAGAQSDAAADECLMEKEDFDSYRGFFSREKFVPAMKALFLALAICLAGVALYRVTPEEHNMTALMLTVSTLGILCSLVPSVRSIKMSFQLGQYFILIFCITIASTVNFAELARASSSIVLYTLIVMFGATVLQIILCRFAGIDTDTQIITATAGIFSPVFVPVVATSLKNRDIIVGGLAAGIIGYIIGTYLGISFAYVLKLFA